MEPVSLTVGEILFQPQDYIRYIYFPESAVVSELQMLEDGRTVEVAMTGKEGIVGLSCLFDSRAANWTEVAAAGNALKLNPLILQRKLKNFACSCSSLI